MKNGVKNIQTAGYNGACIVANLKKSNSELDIDIDLPKYQNKRD